MGFPCAVESDLNRYLAAIDREDRREAAIAEVFATLMAEYTAQARREAENIINDGCQSCYGSGCRKCEGNEE